jgi:hypothetical protein
MAQHRWKWKWDASGRVVWVCTKCSAYEVQDRKPPGRVCPAPSKRSAPDHPTAEQVREALLK